MAGIREIDKALFPIKNIPSVIQLFKNQLEDACEPDLALLSVVAGAVENSLTCRSNTSLQVCEPVEPTSLPILEFHTIETLYNKFHTIMKSAVECNKGFKSYATRELVKKVSDVVWNSLTRSYYKDRAHLQSLYSYLTGSKLDCFGVAFAVVAGCQALGYSDVHLALSEDHAWVVFGERGTETAEVTWHGKGNEDKRGQEIGKGVSARSWLYVNNKPVVCTRHMEVAALVSAINPSLNATHDAFEVALLQQDLLWLLYDLGHLKKYPMAIGNLGDLEEIAPKGGRTPCSVLFEEAISSARTYYNNQHVYPYTYQGGYFYRNKMYKEAFESWANASDVIRLYNYSRDDEEIYKEFLEIANELIPHIMKVESSGFSANTILKKPECFANLLRFYDGICQWEEGSATPVLHIGWAKPLVNTISKFDAEVRAQVEIVCGRPEDDTNKRSNGGYFNNNNYEKENGTNETDILTSLNSKALKDDQSTSNFHPSIEALTAACSEKILNPEYLLQGDGSPFVGGDEAVPLEKENGKPSTSKQETEEKKEEVPPPVVEKEEPVENKRPTIILHSQKMKELKDLLLAEKLNTHAISLHLTAQSQVQVGKKGRSDSDGGIRPKRARRE
ncbi:menin [Tribolium castaneum]|uniref:Menin n=1 Tax=Tribolium castaneum TaxID=7070 RepID=D2A2K0_TRICA|nr:PREDICTED: menin [Tribolium castaneum]EFA02211.1 Menin-like Protein [Tribolium castaneum]|eukprot:XP_969971.1 PREDICTED: menin [Tribolium castaneum]